MHRDLCSVLISAFVCIGYLFRAYLFSFDLIRLKPINAENYIDLGIAANHSFQCVKTKLLLKRFRTTICIHDVKRDTDVSDLIIRNGIWEEHLRSFTFNSYPFYSSSVCIY